MPRSRGRGSLAARFALVFAGFAIAVALVGLLGTWATTTLYREEVEQRLNLDLAANLLKEGPLMENGEIRPDSLEHLLHMLMVINPRLEIYVLEETGAIRSFSAEEGKVKLTAVDLAPIHELLAGAERLPIRGDDPRHPGRQAVFSVAPIDAEGFNGYLYVVLGGEIYESIAQRVRDSLILRLSTIWGLALVFLVAALGAGISWFLTRRLRRLDRDIQSYRSEAGARSAEPAGDELDRLELSFEEMRHRIDSQMREIETIERHRRELVANVSHDLRTPLATLQGYLETVMLKGARLGEDERQEYLQIAYRQSESLGRLIDQLFELALLDSEQSPLEIETFSLGELIQDVASKFSLAAEQRGLALTVDLPVGERTTVTGDLRLLERVLDNLIENALRHTPAGGVVTVGLRPRTERIEVRVSDTGEGIAAGDLERVFDRFYRAGRLAEGKAAGERGRSGSGLGLAIAKRIVELHGSAIEAASEPGRGSTFAFRLARAA